MLPCRRWPDPLPKASSASRPSTITRPLEERELRRRRARAGGLARDPRPPRPARAGPGALRRRRLRQRERPARPLRRRAARAAALPRHRHADRRAAPGRAGRLLRGRGVRPGAQPRAQLRARSGPRPNRSPTARSTTSPPPRAPCCTRTRPRCGAPRARLGLPVTRAAARNGTPELALEVQRLYRESRAGLARHPRHGRPRGRRARLRRPASRRPGPILLRQLGRALGPEGAAMRVGGRDLRAVWWTGEGVEFIDQRRLPHSLEVGAGPGRRGGRARDRGDGGARRAGHRRAGGLRPGAGGPARRAARARGRPPARAPVPPRSTCAPRSTRSSGRRPSRTPCSPPPAPGTRPRSRPGAAIGGHGLALLAAGRARPHALQRRLAGGAGLGHRAGAGLPRRAGRATTPSSR